MSVPFCDVCMLFVACLFQSFVFTALILISFYLCFVVCSSMLHVLLYFFSLLFFFFKQKTAYEMRISDWSSDVCSSDLALGVTVEYVHGDVLDLAWTRRFDRVLNWGNVFSYFDNDADGRRVLAVTAEALKAGGRLLIDTMNY